MWLNILPHHRLRSFSPAGASSNGSRRTHGKEDVRGRPMRRSWRSEGFASGNILSLVTPMLPGPPIQTPPSAGSGLNSALSSVGLIHRNIKLRSLFPYPLSLTDTHTSHPPYPTHSHRPRPALRPHSVHPRPTSRSPAPAAAPRPTPPHRR